MKESKFIELLNLYIDQQIPPEETAPAQGRGRVFEEPRRSRWGYYAAGLAAAACVSLVAVLEVGRPGGGISAGARTVVQQTPVAARSVPAPTVAPVRSNVAVVRFLPRTDGYVARHLRFLGSPDGPFFAISDPEKVSFSLTMSPTPALRVTPRQSMEDFVFTHDSAAPESPKIFRSPQPGDESEENAAIEFQR
jgi:hypothetical protein